MSGTEELKPLKTWSYLAGRRRKPSEYEIVSTNLHFSTNNPDAPFELDPNFPIALWFKKYRNGSPITHKDWDLFRDPDEVVYRTYNILQDGQETYVTGLLNQFSERGHDTVLEASWASALARLYTPSRYLFHTLQMACAYLAQMAPASTISNCATYQAADSLRWLTHVAYRTKELSKTFPTLGFGEQERQHWEQDIAWQGWRRLIEEALIAYDWAECFTAFNIVIRPAIEECILRGLVDAARHNGDTLLGLITDSELADAQRHRRWTAELVRFMLEEPGNASQLSSWAHKWSILADTAIQQYASCLPDVPDLAEKAVKRSAAFRQALSL